MNTPFDMTPGYIHKTTKYGDFKIIQYKRNNDVTIEFLNTGFITKTQSSHIRRDGQVKDPYAKIIKGVACKGMSNSTSKSKAYITWIGMVSRCYCKKTQDKHPTYKGCSVCDEWLCFEVFEKWYCENYPKDGLKYHLDKDIKVDGNRIYSPETCMFVTQRDNNQKAKSKNYELKNPQGLIVRIYNLAKFCKEHDLNQANLRSVLKGTRNHHKGYTRA